MRSVILAFSTIVLFATQAHAGEIRMLSANVFTDVLDEHFRESGNKVVFECVTARKVKDRIQSGVEPHY